MSSAATSLPSWVRRRRRPAKDRLVFTFSTSTWVGPHVPKLMKLHRNESGTIPSSTVGAAAATAMAMVRPPKRKPGPPAGRTTKRSAPRLSIAMRSVNSAVIGLGTIGSDPPALSNRSSAGLARMLRR